MTQSTQRPALQTPLVEGNQATFFWKGDLLPYLVGDFNDWDWTAPIPLQPAGPGRWACQMSFPEDAYLEYAFWVAGQRELDPLNPQRVFNGTGERNNYFYMPGAHPNALTRPLQGQETGRVTRCSITDRTHLARPQRTITFYAPPVPDPCPLLVVFDGNDFLRRGKLLTIVDRLIAARKIRPLALALVENAGPARFVEYACSDSTVLFVLNQVLPMAQSQLNLYDPRERPGGYALLGASMGGLMALYTCLRVPQVFGSVLCQSGAYSLHGEDFSIYDLATYSPVVPVKIWMDVGRFDFLLHVNRKMRAILQTRGYCVSYQEHNGGHNYTSWRNQLPGLLAAAFAPQD